MMVAGFRDMTASADWLDAFSRSARQSCRSKSAFKPRSNYRVSGLFRGGF
jgi:hypothetical protein